MKLIDLIFLTHFERNSQLGTYPVVLAIDYYGILHDSVMWKVFANETT
jgi:hypothetical protein